jgi:hypothetical protein
MEFKDCGVRKICPGCGAGFTCDYERGASCWCQSDFPSRAAAVQQERGCHCAACLKRLIAEGESAGN